MKSHTLTLTLVIQMNLRETFIAYLGADCLEMLSLLAGSAPAALAGQGPAQLPAIPFGAPGLPGAPSLLRTPGFYPPSFGAQQLALVDLRDAVMGIQKWNNWPGGKAWVQPSAADASDAERKPAKPPPKAAPALPRVARMVNPWHPMAPLTPTPFGFL